MGEVALSVLAVLALGEVGEGNAGCYSGSAAEEIRSSGACC